MEKELKHELITVDIILSTRSSYDEFLIGTILADSYGAEFLEKEIEDGQLHLWYAVKADFVRNQNDFINSIKMITENLEVRIYRIPRNI